MITSAIGMCLFVCVLRCALCIHICVYCDHYHPLGAEVGGHLYITLGNKSIALSPTAALTSICSVSIAHTAILSVQSEKMGEFCAKQPVPASFVREKRSLIDWKPAAFTVLAQKCFHKMGRWQWVNIWAINRQVQLFCSINSFHQPISSTSASIWLKYLSLQSWVNLGRYSNDCAICCQKGLG